MALLAIPEVCANKIITVYHSSLFAGHQGVIFFYYKQQILCTKLNTLLMAIYKRCHICQLACNEKPPMKELQTRVNLNYRSLSRLIMDLKVMPRSNKGHKYILCIIDEMTNYLITVPIHQYKSEEIGDALIENVITKYCVPDYITMDQESTFMSSLMNYLNKK